MRTLTIPPKQVRFAGLCYLIIIVCGVGSEVALRGPLIDMDSASATVQTISANLLRFRLSILADVVMALADVGLALLLFWIFRRVSAGLALSALIFRLLQAGLIAASLLTLQAALLLLPTAGTEGNVDLVLSFIVMHAYGYDLGLIFFGINCLLTALLILRSGFVPKVIGVCVGLSGLVYLTGSVLRFLAPDLHGLIGPAYAVPLIAETAFCLWLLVLPRHRQPSTRYREGNQT